MGDSPLFTSEKHANILNITASIRNSVELGMGCVILAWTIGMYQMDALSNVCPYDM